MRYKRSLLCIVIILMSLVVNSVDYMAIYESHARAAQSDVTVSPSPTAAAASEMPDVQVTPEFTSAPSVTPDGQPTPVPTSDPADTAVPTASAAPDGSSSPVPSELPEASNTPGPSKSPVSSSSPAPSASPLPTVTPVPTPPIKNQHIRILFIGNSHTAQNNLPYMVQSMAESDGYTCDVMGIAANGYNLTKFSNPTDVYGAIVYDTLRKYRWDYVVLQENRQKIIENRKNTETAVKTLYPEIKNAGAKLIMYVPHSDKIGDFFNINDKLVYLTNYQITDAVAQVNYMLAANYDGLVADYGLNNMRLRLSNPEIELYKADMLHPSLKGSYLAAFTIYSAISGMSPMDNQYVPESRYDKYGIIKNMNKAHAEIIRQFADPKISIGNRYTVIQKGNTGRLYASFKKHNNNRTLDEYNNIIQWRSIDQNGISINKITGEFTALASGRYLVSAYTDSGLVDYALINVQQPSEAFTLKQATALKVEKGYKGKLDYVIAPADTTDSIKWFSEKPNIVGVDSNGTITAKSIGVSKITAVTDSGLTASVNVIVRLGKPSNIKLKAVKYKAKKKNNDNRNTSSNDAAQKKDKYVKIAINWKNNPRAVSYQVFRKRTKKNGYKQIAVTTTNKFVDKKKKTGMTYSYKIKAIFSNSRCNSEQSDVKNIKV